MIPDLNAEIGVSLTAGVQHDSDILGRQQTVGDTADSLAPPTPIDQAKNAENA